MTGYYFFFKQKTAYEMRISDWSSDVCSSDLTTPALLMGAASANLPTIGVSGGPQLRGVYRGAYIGSGTNIISMSEQLRSGEITVEEFHEAEAGMNRSIGSCMTMGTASSMASMVEALGVGLRSEEHTSELQSLMRI